MSVDHISASQIGMFSRCGEQYRRRYIEGLIMPPGIAAACGRGIHKGAELNYIQKIESFVDLPPAHVAQAAVAHFEATVHEGIFLTPDEESMKVQLLDEARYEAERMSELFTTAVAPNVQPEAVERKITVAPPEIAPVTLTGIIDVTAAGRLVRDLKSSKVKWSEDKVAAQLQTPVYRYLYEQHHGVPPARIIYDVLVKTKTPQVQALEAEAGPDGWTAFMNRAKVMLNMIHKGNFAPADPGAWNCSPKWCGYWWTCPYVPESRRQWNRKATQ